MNIAIDVILVCIVISCIIAGRVRGFVRTVLKLAAFVLSWIGAFLFYTLPADMLYDRVFFPKLTSMIEGSIRAQEFKMTLAQLFVNKPAAFVDILDRYSTVSEVENYYNTGSDIGIAEISEFMAAPIARGISDMLGFAAVYFGLIILLGIVVFIIDKICKLPVLKGANRLLGTLIGAVTGLMLAWVISWAAGEILPYLCTAYPDVFGPGILENSVVFKILYNFNPLTLFNLK